LILHKLTEDILSCSLRLWSAGDGDPGNLSEGGATLSRRGSRTPDDPSWKRVRSLQDYHSRNRNCCLVDDPSHVQIVMSRSDIANVLQQCLGGVTTTSGIPVKSPKFVVIPETAEKGAAAASSSSEESLSCLGDYLKRQLRERGIRTPLIVKPLIAAGTKQSHRMVLAWGTSSASTSGTPFPICPARTTDRTGRRSTWWNSIRNGPTQG
jgi:Inositol 1,3,4-trisphosphate 5/6-kinase ATP-grasp domain